MRNIESVVAKLPYERDPCAPFRYDAVTIERLEERLGVPLPDELRWYLANIGWLRIDYGHGAFLLRSDDYLRAMSFEAIGNEVFALSGYEDFVKGREGARLPGDPAAYFPFATVSGGNLSATMRLLVALSGEDRGSIWVVHTIGHFDKGVTRPAIRLAADLAEFLSLLGPDRALNETAAKNNRALFERLLEAELASPRCEPTSAADPQSLIGKFFEGREDFAFDGVRNAEYQYRFYGHEVDSAEAFARKADSLARPDHGGAGQFPGPIARNDSRFEAPSVFEFPLVNRTSNHGFRLMSVESRVGDNFRLTEHFLLHDDGARWTMLRRHDAAIDNVRVKGVGTFAFDATYKWKLKRKVTPAWSDFPAEVLVNGEEDALTGARIALIGEIIGHEGFRAVFEEYVFQLYARRFYPEFESMPDDEREEWADCYPRIDAPAEIWRLLGRKLTITARNDTDFQVHADAIFDPEHGLDVEVQDWRIARSGF